MLRNSSLDWRCVGLTTTICAAGTKRAVWMTRMAATVDLPDWREQQGAPGIGAQQARLPWVRFYSAFAGRDDRVQCAGKVAG